MFTHYRHELGGIAICFFFFFGGEAIWVFEMSKIIIEHLSKQKKKKKKTPILTRSRKREKRNLKEIH